MFCLVTIVPCSKQDDIGLVLGKDIRNGFNIIDEYVMFALVEGSGVREGSLDV